jgi:ABC-2 type transport system ATP-binding protein
LKYISYSLNDILNFLCLLTTPNLFSYLLVGASPTGWSVHYPQQKKSMEGALAMLSTRQQTAIVEIAGLSKTYRGAGKSPVYAVEKLNLSIEPGQVFGFLGANGAGKTTTIKMLCGLITPTSGRLQINGYDVLCQRSMVMQQIGAVLEGTRNVYWRLTAWQNLLYFGRLKGCSGKAMHTRAEQLLRELDLWERRNDSLRFFSRGMQQKVAIACALIADPPVILLDEPTLGLDIQAARTVKEWIEKLVQEQGKTVVLTTHQLDIAQELCDRVAIMRKGQLLTDMPLDQLLHMFREKHYLIRLKGHLEQRQLPPLCAGFSLEKEGGETQLSGMVLDQDTLYALLDNLRALGLPLLSVARVEPNLEEVFVRLIEGNKEGEHNEHIAAGHV